MNIVKGMGVLTPLVDVRNYVAVCAARENDFPEEYVLPGKLPPVEDQKDVQICVGYALKFVADYFDMNQGDNVGPMSAGYLYGNRSNNYTGFGRRIGVANHDFLRYGVCAHAKYPEVVEVPYAIELFKSRAYELFPSAYPNRISSYYEIHDKNGIKAALMSGSPVVISIEWYEDIEIDMDGVMRTACVPNGYYHAIVIYGWDRRGWKIQNSWGTDWGKEGRAIIPYDIPRREAWGYTDTYSEKANKQREEKIAALNSELTRKETEINDLVEKYHAALQLVEEKESKVYELETRILHIESAKQRVDALCDSLNDQIKCLRLELQSQKTTAGESIEALQEMIAIKQSELALLESDKTDMAKTIKALYTELSEYNALQEDIDRLGKSHEKIKEEYAAQTDELQNAKSALEIAKCQIEKEKSAAHALMEEVDKANATIESLGANLEAEREKRAELENRLMEIKKPFSSGIGKIIAKIINWLLNTFGGDHGADT